MIFNCFAVTGLFSQDLQNGLKLYFRFNNNYTDYSGKNCYTNAVFYSYTTDRFNVQNGAIYCSGFNTRILCEDPGEYSDKISISAWFKAEDYRYQAIAGNYDYDTERGFELGTTLQGEIFFRGGNSKGESVFLKSDPYVYDAGIWHHLVGIVNDSLWSLYIDGKLVDFTQTFQNNIDLDNIWQFSVGHSDFSANVSDPLFLMGAVDDVRFYDRVLNTAEIALLYDYKCELNISAFITDASGFDTADGAISISTSGGAPPYHFNWSTGDTVNSVNNLSFGKYYLEVSDAVGCKKDSVFAVDAFENGLISYYPFNNDANDYSGRENHGIEHSNEIYVLGVKGEAHDFNGYTDYIQLTNSLDITNGLSFSFWIKSRSMLESEIFATIIAKHRVYLFDRPGFFIVDNSDYFETPDGMISAYFYGDQYEPTMYDHVRSLFLSYDSALFFPLNKWTIYKQGTLSTNKWSHFVFNTTPTEIQLWINGELYMTKTRDYLTYYNDPVEPTFIGNMPWGWPGSNNHFNGVLDEFKIYDRALTDEEIVDLYTEICNIEINGSVQDETFPGSGDGAIQPGVTGGSGQYSFIWNTNQTSEDLNGLTAGSYTVMVTDSFNCSITDTFVVSSGPCNLELTYTSEKIFLPDRLEADIDITVTGGIQPYTYSWSNGAATGDIMVTEAGDYHIVVTDLGGCIVEDTITIEEVFCDLRLYIFKAFLLSGFPDEMNDSNGYILLTIEGGETPYSIRWSTGDTVPELSGIPEGIYYVKVTDNQGCIADTTIILKQGDCEMYLRFDVYHVSAHNKSDGSLTVHVLGGVRPYSYSWNTGEIWASVYNKPVGTYTVTVTDSVGCSEKSSTSVDEPRFNISGNVYEKNGVLKNGQVILYYYENDSYRYISDIEVDSGDYSFLNIFGGEYILLAIPYDNNSGYLPTYRVNDLFWQKAYKTFVDGNITDADIRLVPKELAVIGTGSISGRILVETPSNNIPGSHIPVHILRDEYSQGYSYVSDSLGNFEFTNIPYNKYTLFAHRPGFECVGDVVAELTPEKPQIENVEILIRSYDILITIKKEERLQTKCIVYPTSIDDFVTIYYELNELEENMIIKVYSTLGTLVYKKEFMPEATKGELVLPASVFTSGINYMEIIYKDYRDMFYLVK